MIVKGYGGTIKRSDLANEIKKKAEITVQASYRVIKKYLDKNFLEVDDETSKLKLAYQV